jgi:hypothetical protein
LSEQNAQQKTTETDETDETDYQDFKAGVASKRQKLTPEQFARFENQSRTWYPDHWRRLDAEEGRKAAIAPAGEIPAQSR